MHITTHILSIFQETNVNVNASTVIMYNHFSKHYSTANEK